MLLQPLWDLIGQKVEDDHQHKDDDIGNLSVLQTGQRCHGQIDAAKGTDDDRAGTHGRIVHAQQDRQLDEHDKDRSKWRDVVLLIQCLHLLCLHHTRTVIRLSGIFILDLLQFRLQHLHPLRRYL